MLSLIDPMVQAAAAATLGDGSPGPCQQTWCPVCAAAAIASGRQHPLLAIVTDHGATLMALLRALAHPGAPGPPPHGAPPDHPDAPTPSADSRYEHIPVTVHD